MPIVRVEWLAGRSEDQKAAVAEGIAEVLRVQAGVKPESLFIVFEDVERSNWATGGVLASRARAPNPPK